MASPWRHRTVTAPADGVSSPVYIPQMTGAITVQIQPGEYASGKAQFTIASPAAVHADPDAVVWEDWEAGEVEEVTTLALISVVTALRASATGGDVVMNVLMSQVARGNA